jgi:hypothetical protein
MAGLECFAFWWWMNLVGLSCYMAHGVGRVALKNRFSRLRVKQNCAMAQQSYAEEISDRRDFDVCYEPNLDISMDSS